MQTDSIANRAPQRWRLAGGCDSPVRSGWPSGAPVHPSSARGAYAFDEPGAAISITSWRTVRCSSATPIRRWSPDSTKWPRRLGLGQHPSRRGTPGRTIRAHLPSMERMRFVTTGTEAVMSAIRVARAFTGRDLMLKFAGNYHGHFDLALLDAGASAHTADASRGGIPRRRDARRARRALQRPRLGRRAAARARGRLGRDRGRADRRQHGIRHAGQGFLEGLRERAHASARC